MQRHSWREQTEDGVRFHRASYHAGRWKYETQMKGDEDWSLREPMEREDWERLREVLWRKYQRKRCPWKLIEQIDKLLENDGDDE